MARSSFEKFVDDLRELFEPLKGQQIMRATGTGKTRAHELRTLRAWPSDRELAAMLSLVGAHKKYRFPRKAEQQAERRRVLALQGKNPDVVPRPLTVADDMMARYRKLSAQSAHRRNIDVLRPPKPVALGEVPELAEAYQDRRTLATQADAQNLAPLMVVGQVASETGGVGKSQLAAKMFRESASTNKLWIDASPGLRGIVNAYATAASVVQVEGYGLEDREDRAKVYLRWLEQQDDWFIVLDDLQDFDDLQAWLPKPKPAGRVVITTRAETPESFNQPAANVSLGVYSPEESEDYLSQRLGAAIEAGVLPARTLQDAAEVAAVLEYLPLALSQAAATMIAARMSCADYVTRFNELERWGTEPDSFGGSILATGGTVANCPTHAAVVGRTTTLALRQARHLMPGPMVQSVAMFLALLDPAGVPEEVLQHPLLLSNLGREMSGALGIAESVTQEQMTQALKVLQTVGLISYVSAAEATNLRMHALTGLAIRIALQHEPIHHFIDSLMPVMVDIWNVHEVDDVTQAVLRNNALSLLRHGGESLRSQEADSLRFMVAESLVQSTHYRAARDYFSDMVDYYTTLLPKNHRVTLRARRYLAEVEAEHFNLQQGIQCWEELLATTTETLGEDDLETLITRRDAAHFRGIAGHVSEAVEEYRCLVPLFTDLVGPNHRETFSAVHGLAFWTCEAGLWRESVELLEDLIPRRIVVQGAHDYLVLRSTGNLAQERAMLGALDEAIEEYEQLLALERDVLGENSIQYLMHSFNQATWIGVRGEHERARDLLLTLQEKGRNMLGPNHLHYLVIAHGAAHYVGMAGDPTRARTMYQQLVPVFHQNLGASHPRTLLAVRQLAHWEGIGGQPAAALRGVRDVLATQCATLGADHPSTIDTRHSLAYWLAKTGDHDAASSELDAVIVQKMDMYGPDHYSTKESLALRERWADEGLSRSAAS